MIWIIGKNGVVASALIRLCQIKGINFFATSSAECNLLEKGASSRIMNNYPMTKIINTAAYTAVDLAEQEKEKAFDLNFRAAVELSSQAKNRGIKLIHFSTDYVFDGMKQTTYFETDETNPLNVYGLSKLAFENYLLNEDKNALVIRTSWVFGSIGHSFVKAMVKLMLKHQRVSVVTDQISRPTYSGDLAKATLLLQDCCGLYHFANQEILSRFEYAQKILKILREINPATTCERIDPILTQKKEGIAIRPSFSALDLTKTERELQTKIKTIDEPLAKVIKDYLKELSYDL